VFFEKAVEDQLAVRPVLARLLKWALGIDHYQTGAHKNPQCETAMTLMLDPKL
jgi:hypothetical protein